MKNYSQVISGVCATFAAFISAQSFAVDMSRSGYNSPYLAYEKDKRERVEFDKKYQEESKARQEIKKTRYNERNDVIMSSLGSKKNQPQEPVLTEEDQRFVQEHQKTEVVKSVEKDLNYLPLSQDKTNADKLNHYISELKKLNVDTSIIQSRAENLNLSDFENWVEQAYGLMKK